MIYLIAALVACIAVIAWQRGTIRTARERGEAIAANAASERVTARKRAETDARLLADAWALLHDDKRRGKALNHAAWLVARSEWCQRWRGEV
jgi:hypothetical protein